MKVLELLDELKEEINGSPKSVFSSKKSVDSEILLEILEDLINAIPEEIEEAQKLLCDKQKIIDDAKKDAEKIIKSAEEELARKVSEDEVTKAAEVNAKELLQKANINAKEITVGAKEYADEIMRELELYFGDYLKLVRKNRLQLSGKRKTE
jgi:cell division septum initiation protein DivIVA